MENISFVAAQNPRPPGIFFSGTDFVINPDQGSPAPGTRGTLNKVWTFREPILYTPWGGLIR
jgi:hypothetical protein